MNNKLETKRETMELWDQIQDTIAVIREKVSLAPQIGVVLGTGLGGFGSQIEGPQAIPYEALPHFPRSTVESHSGQFIFGRIKGKPVVVMEGRIHLYEGYRADQVAYPVRVMQGLGVKTLIASNAAGGMNPSYAAGDLMVIEDHINLMGFNPLIGPNDERLGIRFPDMSAPYDPKLIAQAEAIAKKEKIPLHRGVYVAVAGPNLETRAEYRFLRGIGADAVGMSTVPEVLVGVHAQMRIAAISVITDLCIPETLKPANIEAIIRIANEAEPKLTALITGLIAQP